MSPSGMVVSGKEIGELGRETALLRGRPILVSPGGVVRKAVTTVSGIPICNQVRGKYEFITILLDTHAALSSSRVRRRGRLRGLVSLGSQDVRPRRSGDTHGSGTSRLHGLRVSRVT